MRYLQPTLQASHVTGQQPREGTECWLIVAGVLTTHSVFTSHLVPQVTLGKTTRITRGDNPDAQQRSKSRQ